MNKKIIIFVSVLIIILAIALIFGIGFHISHYSKIRVDHEEKKIYDEHTLFFGIKKNRHTVWVTSIEEKPWIELSKIKFDFVPYNCSIMNVSEEYFEKYIAPYDEIWISNEQVKIVCINGSSMVYSDILWKFELEKNGLTDLPYDNRVYQVNMS